jgi:hypothetical protein
MLVNIKVTVTNSETNEVISEKLVEKLANHFVRSDKNITANFVKVYFMSHNNKKESNFRQFDEIQSLSANLKADIAYAVKTIDSDTVKTEVKEDAVQSETKQEIKKILSKKQAKKALAKALRK